MGVALVTSHSLAEESSVEKYNLEEPHFFNSHDMRFAKIPAGEYLMGSPDSEKSRAEDEKQKKVMITEPFWIQITEVTQDQWKSVTGISLKSLVDGKVGALGRGANLKNTPSVIHSSHPMSFVNYEDVINFCKSLTEKEKASGRLPEGYVFSLPTEAQWEYAARAGTTEVFAFGNVLTSKDANILGKYPYGIKGEFEGFGSTSPVASFLPNKWGVYDMHGNVYEWCLDWFVDELPGGKDPKSIESGDSRSIRGGAWNRRGESCRSAYRYSYDPTQRTNNIGFRVVLVRER